MKRARLLIAGLSLSALGACGGSDTHGPTFADVAKDHAKAAEACASALGADQDELRLFVPLEEDKSAKLSVEGRWVDSHDALACTVKSASDSTEIRFATDDDSGSGDVTAHRGSVYGWTVENPSTGYPSGTQDRLNDITKALAG